MGRHRWAHTVRNSKIVEKVWKKNACKNPSLVSQPVLRQSIHWKLIGFVELKKIDEEVIDLFCSATELACRQHPVTGVDLPLGGKSARPLARAAGETPSFQRFWHNPDDVFKSIFYLFFVKKKARKRFKDRIDSISSLTRFNRLLKSGVEEEPSMTVCTNPAWIRWILLNSLTGWLIQFFNHVKWWWWHKVAQVWTLRIIFRRDL